MYFGDKFIILRCCHESNARLDRMNNSDYLKFLFQNSCACSVIRVIFRSVGRCTCFPCGYGLGASLVVAIPGGGTKVPPQGMVGKRAKNVDLVIFSSSAM